MLKSAVVHHPSRSLLERVFVLVIVSALALGLAAFLSPAHGQAASPDVYVSSPTLPLIEWTAEDTLFRPRFPVGEELDDALAREREEMRERAEEAESPAQRAAELRAEQASGLLSTIESITMLEDAALNGYYFIPADPSGAVGPNHVLSVVNSSIRWHTTAGVAQNSQRLGMNSSGSIVGSFYESLNPINSLFDPKAYYDTQAGRFLVVALEKGNSPTTSRILLAVSDDSDPNGTWYYLAINSKVNIGGNDCWADYPSLGVDEQAVYITNNMFTWPGSWGGNRLWIVDKTAFYAGSGGSATIYDPWALSGASGFATTCMVASVFGTAPAGNTGTWLLSYSGLTDGTNEYVGFLRVDNPIASPTFTYTQVNCGNVDNTSLAMPKSSQPGTAVQLEMNDNRALAACYRNNRLYLCAQVVPPSGADAGQATVHWWKFNSTTPASISLVDHGNVGGEEIASGTNTSFPSIAVDASDNIAVGFSASGASVYPGSYYAVHAAGDAAGTTQAPVAVATGVDFYYRAFGGSRNRWGDYTVTAVDPTGSTFWTYNKYALSRGSVLGGYPSEDGRWGTRWASFTVSAAPAPLAASLTAPNGGESWGFGSAHNITWSVTGGTAPVTVDLDYSTNSGGAWTSITTGLANSGSYAWTVPAAATANARVRVTAHDAAAGSASDASNADFTMADLTAPTVSITAPTGGETWASGSAHNITWTASDNVGVTSIKLEISTNNGGSWSNISVGEANDGTYAWTVPAVATAQAKVRVTAYDAGSNSAASTSAAFTITVPDATPPTVTVNAPNGGESWGIGTVHAVTWTASDNIGVSAVAIDYSANNGGSWSPVASGLANSGTYSWTTPGATTGQGLIRVTASDANTNSASDVSNAVFSLVDLAAPTVSVTAPTAGNSWVAGSSHAITWTASDNVAVTAIRLEFSSNNGGAWSDISVGEPNDGTYTWSVPAVATAQAKVRVTATDAAANSASSTTAAFTITVPDATPPTVTVSAPNGGESWGVGTVHAVTWTASDNIGVSAVAIDYSANNGGSWSPVASGLANSGTYSWTTPGTPTAQGLIRVTASDAAANSASDVSNTVFSLADLAAPTVSVTAPTAGASWAGSSSHAITWTASDNVGVTAIRLEFSSNNGGAWSDISVGESNDGTYTWSVPAVATAQAKVRVTATDAAANSTSATSGAFTVTVPDATPPTVTLTAPNGGGTLAMGAGTSITWTAGDNVAVTAIALYYSTNNGGSWSLIASGLANSGTRSWTVPNTATSQALVRVVATDAAANSAQDESDAVFTIADQTLPAVAVTAPGAGVTWVVGTSHAITWTASDNMGVTAVALEISTDNGGTWAPIASGLSNSGSYTWSVAGSPTVTAKVRATVQDAAANSKSATSPAFTISSGADATPPTVTVSAPNGGESWGTGTVHNVTWTASDNVGVTSVSVDYSANNGGSWSPVASGLGNGGSYSWITPATPTTQGRVRVTAHDGSANSAADESDAAFTLTDLSAPAVSVTAPAGGSSWVAGSAHNLTWTATDNVAVTSVDLDYSVNGGGAWTVISSGEANDGTYAWTVPGTLTAQALVRATAHDAAGNSGNGQSGLFSIVAAPDVTPPTVTLTAPNGGESWALATGHAITWSASDDVAVTAVKLEYSANGGGSWSVLAQNLANSGTWSWTTPGAPTAQARVRVTATDGGGNSASDASDANFALVDVTAPTVSVSSPAPGNSWTVGSSHPILWSATDNVGVTAIDLAYSVNNGGSWTTITTGEANDGSYNWLVPNAVSAQARVRVTAWDAASNSGSGQSVQFTIGAAPDLTQPTITLDSPNGGEVLAMGASVNITWTASDNIAVTGVTVQYSATGGSGWSTLATGEANDGVFAWTVPPAATTQGLFRVTAFDANGNSASDQSNATFEVRDQTLPVITLTNPAGPVVWTPGNATVITWTASDNVGVTGVDLDFSRDNGGSWTPLAAGEPNDGSFPWTVADLNTTTGILRLTAHDAAGNSGTSQASDIVVQPIVPVTLVSFLATRDAAGVTLTWEVTEAAQRALFHVSRQEPGAAGRARLTDRPLTGQLRYAFVDPSPPAAGADYWLEEIDPRGQSTWYGPVSIGEIGATGALALQPARPNPFRQQTSVAYTLPEPTDVRLVVHDIQGRAVAWLLDRNEAAGAHVAAWDGTDANGRAVAPGIYFLTLEAGAKSITRKVVRVP